MKINKIIKKFSPNNCGRIGEYESWFSDMAAEGLHLKKVGMLAQFIKDEPRQMRYRIDASQSKELISEQKEGYSKRGWDYVTSYGKFNVFASPVEVNAPELYIDPVEQGHRFEYIDKCFTRSAIIVVVSVLLMIGLVLFQLFIDWTPYINLVCGSVVQQVIIVITMSWVGYNSLQVAVAIHNTRKTLLQGKPINHAAPWKENYKVGLIVSCSMLAIAWLGVIIPMMHLATMKTQTLPMDNNDLPIVRLADIEQNTKLVSNTDMIKEVDWANYYSYDWSILAPLQYESREQGVIPNDINTDSGKEYSPSISTAVYKLNFRFMNNGLLSDLIKRQHRIYNMFNEDGKFLEIEHPDFDKLVVYDQDYSKEVFAYKAKAVIYIRYHGNADMNSVINATVEKIKLISD